jgi:hypothetical protein
MSNEVNMIDSICSELEQISVKIEELKQQERKARALLLSASEAEIASQLEGKDYGCGTATVASDAFKIKVTVSKRVKWDSYALTVAEQNLIQLGEDPSEYIEVKRSVSESAYKNWPSTLQSLFVDARTVETSEPAIKIERK